MDKRHSEGIFCKYFSGRFSDKSVAVIFGGEGSERRISEISAKTVIENFMRAGIPTLNVGIDSSGSFYIYSGDTDKILSGEWHKDSSHLIPTYPMRIFSEDEKKTLSGFLCDGQIISVLGAVPVLHGVLGEDGIVQGALRCAGIAYIGCETLCGALCMDKAYTKILAEYLGIPTAKFAICIDGEHESFGGPEFSRANAKAFCEKSFGYPMFIKPCREGSSIGARPILCEKDFECALENALNDGAGRVLIEEKIDLLYELECAYFGGKYNIFTRPGRISSDGKFYDYGRKYLKDGSVEILTDANIPDGICERIIDYSKKLSKLLSIRDISRFDYFLDTDENLYFNEINTFPGMTDISLYPALLSRYGICGEKFSRELADILRARS